MVNQDYSRWGFCLRLESDLISAFSGFSEAYISVYVVSSTVTNTKSVRTLWRAGSKSVEKEVLQVVAGRICSKSVFMINKTVVVHLMTILCSVLAAAVICMVVCIVRVVVG